MNFSTDISEETLRLNELRQYNILDTLTEKDYEDITFMASIICDVPIALISFVDKERQWFKSHRGLSILETIREHSFCAHALAFPAQPLIIPDSRKDDRFKNNPFVIGDPNIVFYAGIPLVSENGFGLGSVCVIDTIPRVLTEKQIIGLHVLSSQVMNLLKMRKNNVDLEAAKQQLENRNKALEESTKKLEASEAQLRTISEGMDVLLALGDANSQAIFFTKAWATLTGKTVEELLNYGWADLIHPEDKERYVKIYLDAFEKRGPFSGEFRILNKSGNYTWLLSQGSPQILPNGTFVGYISSTINITELKNAEENLATTAKRLQLALNAGKLGSYEWDIKSGQFHSSAQFRENLGIDAEADIDMDMIAEMILPDDIGIAKRSFENAIANNLLYDAEYRIKLPTDEIRWIHASGLPVYDDEGVAVQMTGVTIDVTEQRLFNSELERQVTERTSELEEKNIDLERMNQELQSFAYISSHDLQEPLRKIQAFSLRIMEKEHEGLSIKAKDYFGRIHYAAKRMQILINDLLAYSSATTADRIFEHTDLSKLVKEVKDDLKEEIEAKQATIEATGMCTVNIIPFQFRQLLQNLFTNALKFSKPEEPPFIKITSKIAFGRHIDNKKLLTEVEYCHISISDNGIGFDPLYKEKIFELFQRLHGTSEYKGTGIGLAIVKKIVDNHHGIIAAESELGKGATFDIYLPLQI